MLQPWFLPARIMRIVRGLIPADYRQRMHDYFNDYGCVRCGLLEVPYKSNGRCRACMSIVYTRFEPSVNRRSAKRLPKC